MSEIISTTRPTPDGEMLWCVQYTSSWYDSDERMPGNMPVGKRVFVLARGHTEALQKAEPFFKVARKQKDKGAKESIEAAIVTFESLIPTEKLPPPKQGYRRGNGLSVLELADPADAARYKFAVCLVPIVGS